MSDITITPEAAGFSPALERKLDAGIESGLLQHVHCVAVARYGRIVVERYLTAHDHKILADLGVVAFGPETLHDARSVTKSIVSLLYGIALDRGLVPPPGAPLLAQFPDYADLAADPERRRLTIEHALTMTLGMEWDESKPYTSTENSEIAMEFADDRYRFVLDRPIVTPPGEKWIYSGGAVALIGEIIHRGTGKTIAEFAEESLFAPLGIRQSEWFAGKDGVYSAAAGLRLGTRDLLRIAAMLIDRGAFEGKRIVSEAWLDASWQPRTKLPDGDRYGYLWYLGSANLPALGMALPTISGYGNGGQRFLLVPDMKLCGVIFGGDYDLPDSWVGPNRLWHEIILKNLERA